jgi:predicted protein tyrosine phosphatase
MLNLTVCSRALAGKILNNQKYNIDFLISIGDPDRDPPSGYHRFPQQNKLKLTFFDYVPRQGYPPIHLRPYPPNNQELNCVIDFTHRKIKPVLNTQPSVLIHCEFGISRSPAIAQIVLQELGLSADEARQKVLEGRPQAKPNEFVLSLYAQTPNKP